MTPSRTTEKRMRPTTARRTRKPARRRRYTDARLLADAESMLRVIEEKGWWSAATVGTLRDNLEAAKARGLGADQEGAMLLMGTVASILNCYEIAAGLLDFAAKAKRGPASRSGAKKPA